MDMVLYSLLLNQLQNQTECKYWNGFRIEVVDELPTQQSPNTIYLVKSSISANDEMGE